MTSMLMETTAKTGFTWELAATIIGVAVLVVEAFIRIYIHNSKLKEEKSNGNAANSLTDADVNYLKNAAQSIMNNSNKISNQDIKLKNVVVTVDDLKSLIRDVERENFNSLSSVSDKIDVLKNILLEAKMNKK